MESGDLPTLRSDRFKGFPHEETQQMSQECKILILPGDLNDTPHGEDLVLVITEEEFMRMWRRGQVMLRNRALKGKGIHGDLTGSVKLS